MRSNEVSSLQSPTSAQHSLLPFWWWWSVGQFRKVFQATARLQKSLAVATANREPYTAQLSLSFRRTRSFGLEKKFEQQRFKTFLVRSTSMNFTRGFHSNLSLCGAFKLILTLHSVNFILVLLCPYFSKLGNRPEFPFLIFVSFSLSLQNCPDRFPVAKRGKFA